jgi:hypothetical protein
MTSVALDEILNTEHQDDGMAFQCKI